MAADGAAAVLSPAQIALAAQTTAASAIAATARSLLVGLDLERASLRALRAGIEKHLGLAAGALDAQREQVKEIVVAELRRQQRTAPAVVCAADACRAALGAVPTPGRKRAPGGDPGRPAERAAPPREQQCGESIAESPAVKRGRWRLSRTQFLQRALAPAAAAAGAGGGSAGAALARDALGPWSAMELPQAVWLQDASVA